jgi:hypothetical protein
MQKDYRNPSIALRNFNKNFQAQHFFQKRVKPKQNLNLNYFEPHWIVSVMLTNHNMNDGNRDTKNRRNATTTTREQIVLFTIKW